MFRLVVFFHSLGVAFDGSFACEAYACSGIPCSLSPFIAALSIEPSSSRNRQLFSFTCAQSCFFFFVGVFLLKTSDAPLRRKDRASRFRYFGRRLKEKTETQNRRDDTFFPPSSEVSCCFDLVLPPFSDKIRLLKRRMLSHVPQLPYPLSVVN